MASMEGNESEDGAATGAATSVKAGTAERAPRRSRGQRRVTLAHVASHAGVSTTTASLILSGKPEALTQFHADTIQRVQGVAEELGYRANLFASSLHAGGSSFFAMVLNLEEQRDPGTWHYRAFDGELLAGAIQAASSAGVYPIVATAGRDADATVIQSLEAIMAGGVFGTIVRTPSPAFEERIRQRIEQHHPIAVVFPGHYTAWDSNAIDVDNVAVGRTAAGLLHRQRRRRWAIVYDRTFYEGQSLRRQGFEVAAGEVGVPVESIELPAGLDEAGARDELVARFRASRPDGVFVLTLTGSIGAVMACHEMRTRAGGEKLSLVGCDAGFWSGSGLPRITSVDVAWNEVGACAVGKLLELRAGRTSRFDSVLMRARVVPGETCPVPNDTTL